MYKMKVLQVGLGIQMEETGGGWKNCPILLPQESIQEEMAALTSDHQQLFPQALPATTSPLTVPDIPQPSEQETQTKGLQGAESWRNHTGFSEGAGKNSTTLTKPKQTKSYLIPQRSLVGKNTTKFSVSNLLPQGPGMEIY